MPETLFCLRDIHKSFPTNPGVLKSINLDILQGECLVISGANGSGKTVLMRILAALQSADSGTIEYKGQALKKSIVKLRRELGMVFQDADAQIVGETVWEDCIFGPKNLGVSKQELITVVERALRKMSLLAKKDHSPRSLSGGEKRRLAIAGILAMGCSCIIMDEPFANLDWPSVQEVLSAIQSLKEQGHTIMILTHELEKVLAYADRLAILDAGILKACDIPAKVLDMNIEQWGIRDPRQTYTQVKDCTWL